MVKQWLRSLKKYLYAAAETAAKTGRSAGTGSRRNPEDRRKNPENRMEQGTPEYAEIPRGQEDSSAVCLLDELIRKAYQGRASDIHVEPFETGTRIRMRLDGIMVEDRVLSRSMHPLLVARIKILGEMDIAEHRIPQDGHFRMKVEGETVNMRVSVLPTVFGEKAVIRLLSGTGNLDYPDSFGMPPEDGRRMRRLLRAPNGIVYLTGPTGSGKTTTLYLALTELAEKPVNISTIEDPVEKNLPKVNQCQINYQAGMTFEKGLRAILRQDPDIIMVGETRDRETAEISARAAITGHLVLSTLHTNDAVSSILRLKDMGLEPYMVADSLNGVVAQRLMRKLCPECARTVPATDEDRRFLGKPVKTIRIPQGCPACSHTGYQGRIAVHEILVADRTVRKMISSGADAETIRNYALEQQGMKTLRQRGAELVEQGITSMEELMKVAYYEENE